MTKTADRARRRTGVVASEVTDDAARGWYLYGITRSGPLPRLEPAHGDGEEGSSDAPPQLVEADGLAAVVRPVLLAEFGPAALEERLRSEAGLEAMVRSHNRVIESIHAQRPILPARFGVVYAYDLDLASALRSAHDTIVRQLDRLECCDEWAVHVYADQPVASARVASADEALQRLRDECAAASAGRAFFLERQLHDALAAATSDALLKIAQASYDRLAGHAVGAQVTPVPPTGDPAGEVEILRAAFLVRREAVERFTNDVRSLSDGGDGLRCELSGPWPPYSFASGTGEATE